MTRVVVIGAGVGGLSAAAALARAGLDVTVLEAHVSPGGCAATFYHQGYRFDAGATLAGGFYPGGPMDLVAQATGVPAWPAHAADLALVTHLPDGSRVERWGGERRREALREVFGVQAEGFWDWQEHTADALWNLALRLPAWPPQSLRQLLELAGHGAAWWGGGLKPAQRFDTGLAADAFRPVAAHLKGASERLRLFVDGQLLIAAQTTSSHANALYGASALDLPRRGVVHLSGGIGAIAEELAAALRRSGGKLLYRQEASDIELQRGRITAVRTRRGEVFPADLVVANLTPWNIATLLGQAAPPILRRLPAQPEDGWGAFMLYVGVDSGALPDDFPLHHQVLVGEPLGEGNSVFLSLSPAWDAGRAKAGRRALTISTHTALQPWWQLFAHDSDGYAARKAHYANQMLAAAERAIPGLRAAADLILPGTPVTFQRFTRRQWGWVGGFPQTNLLRAWGPRLQAGLWMVGDSIFPGQSTAAVALGGLRVARDVLVELGQQPGLISQTSKSSGQFQTADVQSSL